MTYESAAVSSIRTDAGGPGRGRAREIRQIALTALPALAVLALVLATAALTGTPIGHMTRDMATIGGLHPLAGVVSNLGAFLWCACAAISLFAALCVRSGAVQRFLFCSAALSAYLLLDDFFMIHEELAPRYLGIDDNVVVGALGLATCAYLLSFWRLIARTRYVVLVLALGLLGASAAMDELLWSWVRIGGLEFLIEDGAKFLGIALWCSYHAGTALQITAGR